MIIKKTKKCPCCKKVFNKFIYNGKKWNEEFLFHLKSTHGFPPEVFKEMLEILDKEK